MAGVIQVTSWPGRGTLAQATITAAEVGVEADAESALADGLGQVREPAARRAEQHHARGRASASAGLALPREDAHRVASSSRSGRNVPADGDRPRRGPRSGGGKGARVEAVGGHALHGPLERSAPTMRRAPAAQRAPSVASSVARAATRRARRCSRRLRPVRGCARADRCAPRRELARKTGRSRPREGGTGRASASSGSLFSYQCTW